MFLCAVLILAVAVATGSAGHGRSVGGTKASNDDFPYVVSIMVNGEHTCGGTVINPKQVLTAATCTDGLDPSQIKVRVLKDGSLLDVSETIEHGFYGGEKDFDASLIVLEKETSITPVDLMEKDVNPTTKCQALGFGPSGELNKLAVTTMARRICRLESSYADVTDRMICAESEDGGKQDVCENDIGAPLICMGQQAALVSKGFSCGSGKESKYISVARVYKFIERNLE